MSKLSQDEIQELFALDKKTHKKLQHKLETAQQNLADEVQRVNELYPVYRTGT